MPLVWAGHGDICILGFEDWIAGHERSRMAVGSKPKMNEVEHGRRTGEALERASIVAAAESRNEPPPLWAPQ
jgi:hypothetical protein